MVPLVSVKADGATSASVCSSSGVAALDKTAEKAISSWGFIPATKNGKKIASTIRVRFKFARVNDEFTVVGGVVK